MNRYQKLKLMAADIRKLTIRAMAASGQGHIGGAMSICDLLAVLYGRVMNVDPQDPHKPDRDWLVLSKGHCGPALIATLAYKGYFDVSELNKLNANGTKYPNHCDRLKTPGIDITTGSLGQGLSLASGVAFAHRMAKMENYVYAIIGDGELQEGQNWEAFQFIAHHKLNHLVVLVDNNKRQLDGYVSDICNQNDLNMKFTSFGFAVQSIDGHDVEAIEQAIVKAKNLEKPSVIVLNTEKGHGCSFAEIPGFNHYMVITKEMAENACAEIDRRVKEELL
ncbi:MAG: transketolase [Bacilli bacterium]|jgi:transketolase